MRFASAASLAQCTVPPARGDLSFQLLQVAVEMRECVRLDRAPGLPKLLPVRQFADYPGPLGPDRRGGLGQVAPQLAVAKRLPRRHRKRIVAAQVPNPRGAVGSPRNVLDEASSLVEARISARCTVLTPVFSRDSPPPMCIRHELSPAVQYSAPVASTLRILSASTAVDTSAFFTANVPPNPQHPRRRPAAPDRFPPHRATGSAAGRPPATTEENGRSGDKSRDVENMRRLLPPVERRLAARTTQVRPAQLLGAASEAGVAQPARHHRMLVPDRRRARTGRHHDHVAVAERVDEVADQR